MPERRLQDKVAVITGAGRGIGAACARLFASQGARVVMASRTESELNRVASSINQDCGNNRTLIVKTDVSEEESVENLFRKTKEVFGPVDVLVNNAAIIDLVPFIDQPTCSWDEVLSVNLRGTFLCSREAFRQMRDSGRGGVIINLSSLGGIRGTEKFKGLSSYVASKHAVIGLTESLSVEGKEFGIRVNCVAPGAVDTKMLQKAAPFLKTNTTPLDVAKTILFLCDDHQSEKLTGSVIEIHSNS